MKFRFFFIFLFLLFEMQLSAQQYSRKQLDSLYNAASNTTDLRENLRISYLGYKASLEVNYQVGIMKFVDEISYCYEMLGDYKKALKYVRKSEDYSKKFNNYKYLFWSLCRKSDIYKDLGFKKQSSEIYKSASAVLPKLKGDDFFDYSGEYLKTLNLFFEIPADSVIYYRKLSLSNFKKIKNKSRRQIAICEYYIYTIESLIKSEQIDEASLYIEPAKKHIDTLYLLIKDVFYKGALFENMGYIHYKKGNADSAVFYYKKALPNFQKRNDLSYKSGLYLKLSKVYDLKENKDSSGYYKEKYISSQAELASQQQESIDYASNEILEDKNEEYQAQQFQTYIWIVLTLIIVVICIFLLVRRLKNEKLLKQDIASNLENTSKTILELEAKVNDAFEEVVRLARNNDPSFLTRFLEVYPEFSKSLLNRYPDLLQTELVLCAYLKLNFSNKEIANSTFVTIKAIEMRKNRFRKKMNIPSDEDLYVWINKF